MEKLCILGFTLNRVIVLESLFGSFPVTPRAGEKHLYPESILAQPLSWNEQFSWSNLGYQKNNSVAEVQETCIFQLQREG